MSNQHGDVTVTDIQISFARLVILFVKFGLAAIPAAIILGLIWTAIMLVLGAIFGSFGIMTGFMGGRPI